MNGYEFARLYCQLGWLPIPMIPHTKRPSQKYIHLNETPQCKPGEAFDPEHFAFPWQRFPDLGCAILLRPSNLIVLDCDSPAAVQEALSKSPPTWAVITRQGAHLYYRNPTGRYVRAIHRGTSGKIDVMANGYVIAPPSIHPSGHPYTWAAREPFRAPIPIPDAPEWACQEVMNARQEEVPAPTLETALALFHQPCAGVDWVRVRAVNPKVHAILVRGSEPGADRSRDLWLTINCLVRLGYTDEQIMQTIWNSGAGAKPQQKGVQWLAGEVARARTEILPETRS